MKSSKILNFQDIFKRVVTISTMTPRHPIVVAIFLAQSLFTVALAGPNPETKPAKSYRYAPEKVAGWTILDTLEALVGTRVTLHLANGSQIKGLLSTQRLGKGSATVYLTELSGSEYFGSVVRIDQIVGVEFRNQEP